MRSILRSMTTRLPCRPWRPRRTIRALWKGAREGGRHGLAVLEAARRPDFDLVTVFDGCLSQVDGESHWESFRFGAASLQRGPQRRR